MVTFKARLAQCGISWEEALSEGWRADIPVMESCNWVSGSVFSHALCACARVRVRTAKERAFAPARTGCARD